MKKVVSLMIPLFAAVVGITACGSGSKSSMVAETTAAYTEAAAETVSNTSMTYDSASQKSESGSGGELAMDDVLVHDAHEKDNTLHMMLAMMSGDMPIALGVIRDVEGPTYDEAVHQQIEEVQAKNPTRKLHDLLMKGEIWEVK